MNEYAILAKVKNNLILRRILDAGYKNVAQFCKAYNLSNSWLGDLINMKEPAVDKNGEWYPRVLILADALGVLPDELFTEEQMTARLEQNTAYFELSRDTALALMDNGEDMQRRLENADLVGKLFERAKLKDKERLVLEFRADDQTLEEIGNKWGVSKERVMHIERTAQRKVKRAASLIRGDQAEICDVEPIV